MSFSDPISTYAYDLLRKSIYQWLPQSNEGKKSTDFSFLQTTSEISSWFCKLHTGYSTRSMMLSIIARKNGDENMILVKTDRCLWTPWVYRDWSCCLCVYVCACVRACVRVWVRAWVCVCVCVCLFVYTLPPAGFFRLHDVCDMCEIFRSVIFCCEYYQGLLPSSFISIFESIIFHLQRRKLQPTAYWRENDMLI